MPDTDFLTDYFNPLLSPENVAVLDEKLSQTPLMASVWQSYLDRYENDIDFYTVLKEKSDDEQRIKFIRNERLDIIYFGFFAEATSEYDFGLTKEQRDEHTKHLINEFINKLTEPNFLFDEDVNQWQDVIADCYMQDNFTSAGRTVFDQFSKDKILGPSLMSVSLPTAALSGSLRFLQNNPDASIANFIDTKDQIMQLRIQSLNQDDLRDKFEFMREQAHKLGKPKF